ncbi:MAG: Rpn family recombination-promoting nuclease/putative transposase [Algicola sp.]|nr:Rpn family recombination-promoting nuclease/putative transposase [Algicola sp.]
MQFLNPRTDFAFKKIFGSADSKDILLSFLNAILNLKSPYAIVDITIVDPYQAPKIAGLKHSYLDVKAVDENGKSYIIEMQVLNVESFEKRILYNACKGYANQISKGEDYHLLTDVIAITVTNFVLFPERSSVISKYKLRAEDGDVYCDDLELVFAELPKFELSHEQLESIVDKWLFFLKHADDLTMIPDSLSNVPEIKRAFDIANRASWTQKELEEQERYEITIQDQRGAISLAEKKAAEKGKTEGKMEGLEAVAINLLRSGMSQEQVVKMTGLNAVQVAALKP